MPRRCWTCNTEHDLDEACPRNATVRSVRSAGQPGNTLADHTSPDLFDDSGPKFGPVFTATYESECPSCDERILPGEDIRADGQGGYIHADTQCERIARS